MRWGVVICSILFVSFSIQAYAQEASIQGKIQDEFGLAEFVIVYLKPSNKSTVTDSSGLFQFKNLPLGKYVLRAEKIGYKTFQKEINLQSDSNFVSLEIVLEQLAQSLDEVVITGTMKEISRLESPIPVEVITPKLFQKNSSPTLFEAMGMVNSVKPQINCNICNTGDIHINGMEGAYTMVLIDGMPIVSALSSVYGLNGIPTGLVERVEVVKGPASSLYGSEAMGGIINVITKNPLTAPIVSVDVMSTSWGEVNTDVATKFKVNEKTTSLLGINYFNYQQRIDKNKDGFTDVTLQDRISVFNKWNLKREHNRLANIAARYVYEDRWGGQTQWSNAWRGTDSIYGESIYTGRTEVIANYQLPVREKIITQFSYNVHNQNSYYGTTPYMANQHVGFAQAYWDKTLNTKHQLLLGSALRYTHYDDNTPATASVNGSKNVPAVTVLPGAFIQEEWMMNTKNKLLLGYRYDYDKNHGNIHSPRIAHKYSLNKNNVLRTSFGTGFRVVNLFTEDHAALTGARDVVITEKLNPEQSYNGNLNYIIKVPTGKVLYTFDATAFYSYFTNKIVGDFDTDPNKIIYDNINGYAVSRGLALNTEFTFSIPLKISSGITYMDVFLTEDNGLGVMQRTQQIHAPQWSGNLFISYSGLKWFTIDVTGQWNGPMRLPVLPDDYRPEYSPWFNILNVQLSKKVKQFEFYGGVKNVLNFVPQNPIMRPFDPFDKRANEAVNNPNGYTFDPSYNYASLQGIRGFIGIRYNLY